MPFVPCSPHEATKKLESIFRSLRIFFSEAAAITERWILPLQTNKIFLLIEEPLQLRDRAEGGAVGVS